MTTPRYVIDPFEEEEQVPKKAKKLFGKTDLQKAALEATGRKDTGFRDNVQYKLFTDQEANALGADPESRVWAAWIAWRIDQTKALNKKAINISMDKLIHNIGLKEKRDEWILDHRAEVLKKPTAEELVRSLTGVDTMQARMNKRLSNLEGDKNE